MSVGEFEGVEDRLREVERWLEPTDRAGTWAPPEGWSSSTRESSRACPG
jgi:hypothetical protein